MKNIRDTLRTEWSAVLTTLLFLGAGCSVFADPPSTLQFIDNPITAHAWPTFIIVGALVWLAYQFRPDLYFLRNVGGVLIVTGCAVYFVGLLISPTASWFVTLLILVPMAQGIDRYRRDQRLARVNEELRRVTKTLETSFHVDD